MIPTLPRLWPPPHVSCLSLSRFLTMRSSSLYPLQSGLTFEQVQHSFPKCLPQDRLLWRSLYYSSQPSAKIYPSSRFFYRRLPSFSQSQIVQCLTSWKGHKRIIHGIAITESYDTICEELKHLGVSEIYRKVVVKDGQQHVTVSGNIFLF